MQKPRADTAGVGLQMPLSLRQCVHTACEWTPSRQQPELGTAFLSVLTYLSGCTTHMHCCSCPCATPGWQRLASILKARHGESSPEQLHLQPLDCNNVGLATSSRGVPVQGSAAWHNTAHVSQHCMALHCVALQHVTTEHMHKHVTSSVSHTLQHGGGH